MYTIPRKRYNEALQNLAIEENYYKQITLKRNGNGVAINKYDVPEKKSWHRSKFTQVVYGLFLEAPQPIKVHKVHRIVITAHKVRVRIGWYDWQVFDVR